MTTYSPLELYKYNMYVKGCNSSVVGSKSECRVLRLPLLAVVTSLNMRYYFGTYLLHLNLTFATIIDMHPLFFFFFFFCENGSKSGYRIVSNKRSPSNKRPPNLFSNKTR